MPEKEIKIHLSVKPSWLRIKVALAVIWVLAFFVKSEQSQKRISKAVLSWVQSGMRVYADGKLVK